MRREAVMATSRISSGDQPHQLGVKSNILEVFFVSIDTEISGTLDFRLGTGGPRRFHLYFILLVEGFSP
jgi:hypothetical protein